MGEGGILLQRWSRPEPNVFGWSLAPATSCFLKQFLKNYFHNKKKINNLRYEVGHTLSFHNLVFTSHNEAFEANDENALHFVPSVGTTAGTASRIQIRLRDLKIPEPESEPEPSKKKAFKVDVFWTTVNLCAS